MGLERCVTCYILHVTHGFVHSSYVCIAVIVVVVAGFLLWFVHGFLSTIQYLKSICDCFLFFHPVVLSLSIPLSSLISSLPCISLTFSTFLYSSLPLTNFHYFSLFLATFYYTSTDNISHEHYVVSDW